MKIFTNLQTILSQVFVILTVFQGFRGCHYSSFWNNNVLMQFYNVILLFHLKTKRSV